MKEIGNLFKKDLILGFKDVFIILELVFAVIIMLVLLFIIPEDIDQEGMVYIYDASKVVEEFVLKNSADVAKLHGEYYVDSRDEVIAGMIKDKGAIGLLIAENPGGTYKVELLMQPYTIEGMIDFVNVDLEDLLSIIKPPSGVYPADIYETFRIESLQWGLRDELPFNQRLMPPILMMMVGMIGLFAMVSLVGQERSEGTIQAFKVAPAGMFEFLLSKHFVLIATGIATFSILFLPLMGFSSYPQALLIMLLTILMGSSIGVILGGFFDNPMGAILWVLVFMLILSLPVISLFSPAFSPAWLKIIPSYHILFGLDAAMFPDNNSHIYWQGAGVLAGINLILFPLSGLIFSKMIRKEA